MPRKLGWGGVFATYGVRDFTGKAVTAAVTPVVSRSVTIDSNPSEAAALDSNPSEAVAVDS